MRVNVSALDDPPTGGASGAPAPRKESPCFPRNPPRPSAPPCPPSARRSGRSPSGSTRGCSRTTRSCCGTCSTAGTRPAAAQRRPWPASIAAFAAVLVERPERGPTRCWPGSPTSTPHSASPPTSTRSCTSTCSRAIAEVLGDAVTPEVAAAWDEVYWLMANALIALEARCTTERGLGGGTGGTGGRGAPARGDRRRGLLPAASGRRRNPRRSGRAVRQRPGRAARRGAPDPAVQPDLRPGRRGAPDHRQARSAARGRPGRRGVRTSCTTPCGPGEDAAVSAPFGDLVLDAAGGRRRRCCWPRRGSA